MMCADMRGKTIKLENSGKAEGHGSAWFFMMNTCQALARYTGATDCVSDIEAQALMNEFIVTTKTATQFFSEKTYIRNQDRLDSEFLQERFVLSRSLAMFNHFKLEKVTNHFSNNVYYNDQLF